MELEIAGPNLKAFSRAVTFLGKMSEEMTMQLHRDKLTLTSVNSSRSAYVAFTFLPSFFERMSATEADRARSRDTPSGAIANCRVLVKAFLSAFRGRLDTSSLSLFSLSTAPDSPAATSSFSYPDQHRVVLQFHYKIGVKRTVKINCEATATARPVFDKSSMDCHVATTARELGGDWVGKFASGLDEITWDVKQSGLTMCNHLDPTSGARGMQTRVSLMARDFEQFDVVRPCELTFNLRELRAFVSFCESVSANETIGVHFTQTGKPIIFDLAMSGAFDVQLVLATQTPETAADESSTATGTTAATRTQATGVSSVPSARWPSVGVSEQQQENDDDDDNYVESTPPPAMAEDDANKRARFA